MIMICKHINQESGRCANPKVRQYAVCPYSDPSKCLQFSEKSNSVNLGSFGGGLK